jgi:hypothetical protein
MTKKTIPFDELRQILKSLGYREKRTDTAIVFDRDQIHLLLFRIYGDNEPVDARDIASTRRFLDAWGLLEAADFDVQLQGARSPA